MPSFGKAREISKKDMNFFAEFTANAARMARMMFYGVLVVVAFIAVIVIMIGIQFFANQSLKKQINDYNTLLASEKYANLDVEARNLAQTISEKNQYFYALSEMRSEVDRVNDVELSVADLVKDCLPNDAYLNGYTLSGEVLMLDGVTFNYYTAVQYVNLLDQSNLFTAIPTLATKTVDTAEFGDADMTINPIDRYYEFSIQGILASKVYISTSRYLSGATITAMGPMVTDEYAVGDSFEYTGVASFTNGETTYTLSNVTVDGVSLSQTDFEGVVANDAYRGTATVSRSVVFYYTEVVPQIEEGA